MNQDHTLSNTTYYYSSAKCGSGKTFWALNRMALEPGRYVYAVDRVDEFDVRASRIREIAGSTLHFRCPHVVTLASREGDIVGRDFPNALDEHANTRHVIIIITHEALKRVSHLNAEGGDWELIIDEDPKLWSGQRLKVGVSKPFWQANYNLTDDTPGCSRVTHKADAATFLSVMSDDLTKSVAALHDRIRKNKVVVNLDAAKGWDGVGDKGELVFYMVWDITELAVYSRVTFLANAFDHLISYRLIRSEFPGITMEPIETGVGVVWQERDLTINFVAENHQAGSYFFEETADGRKAVREWCAWVRRTTQHENAYWTSNKLRGDLGLPGISISPKIAGSNALRDRTQCSVLYSAKASQSENEVFASLTNGEVGADEVRRDREFEDLVQIIFRSSLRMPNDPRPVIINVYDREQAEFLESYFTEAGFPFRIRLAFHDLGLKYERQRRGPKVSPDKPPKTAAERSRACRARKRIEMGKAA